MKNLSIYPLSLLLEPVFQGCAMHESIFFQHTDTCDVVLWHVCVNMIYKSCATDIFNEYTHGLQRISPAPMFLCQYDAYLCPTVYGIVIAKVSKSHDMTWVIPIAYCQAHLSVDGKVTLLRRYIVTQEVIGERNIIRRILSVLQSGLYLIEGIQKLWFKRAYRKCHFFFLE